MKQINLTAKPWPDYELLDSGNNKKLERYGSYILVRPETQALWQPRRPAEWKKANAEFFFAGGKGTWKKKGAPETWNISWHDIHFQIRTTSFKHTGVFPEQAVNWEWIRERVGNLKQPQILNLFGYTGIASLVAAKSGAKVTHLDASRQSNAWAKENTKLSGIPEGQIRYITDDALKFAEREVRRGAMYEGIILDPPAFGRGAKNEVWKIEEDLPALLDAIKKIFSPKPGSFFLLNGYAAGYSPESFRQAVDDFFPDTNGGYGELHIPDSQSKRTIPAGIYVRFVR
jgi:23S rRNA (cytosine1962-C5)-methyltransferase